MTKTVTAPLLTAIVGGGPLRFFRTPIDDGRPDLPWYVVDDLHRCLALGRAQRRYFLHKMRDGSRWPMRTIATDKGLVTIAPHFTAQGAIDAAIEVGQVPAMIRAEYNHAGAEAMQKLIAAAPFGSNAWFDWANAAMQRWKNA